MKRLLVVALVCLTLFSLVSVLVPVVLIRPFAPQTVRDLEIAFALRRQGPWLTFLCSAVSVLVSLALARHLQRQRAKVFVWLTMMVQIGLVILSNQNHFEWIFHRLKTPAYADIPHSSNLQDTEMVLGVQINGEAKAFPVSLMAYHHVVNTTVGLEPIVATY